MRYTMPGGTQPVVSGVYEYIQPPRQIVFSWQWKQPDPHADIPTRVDVRFADRGDDTEITVTHERLPSEEARDRYSTGWEGTFDCLERFIDSDDQGTAMPAEETRYA